MTKLLTTLFITALFVGSDYFVTEKFSLLAFGLFFLLVLFLEKGFLLFLAFLSLVHQLFFSYFQRELHSGDIYNFFTHIHETFESFFALFMIVYKPLIFFAIITIAIMIIHPKPFTLKTPLKYPLILLLIMINLNSTLGVKMLPPLFASLTGTTDIPVVVKETPLYPKRDVDTNIIFIIGESMKYSAFVQEELKKQGHFYKKIYAGATNTDVSVPLMINAKTDPLKLNLKNETNLFRLAKKNHFQTTFVSMQSKKSLKYIKPYLQAENIDTYKSYGLKEREPQFDMLLLQDLEKIDFSKPNFIVLHQIGEHSPYLYFEGEKSTPKENYKKSIEYSFAFYKKVYDYLIQTQKPFIMIVTSDHGEFTGEGGRWGHNAFEKTIYEVPFFIASNKPLPTNYQDIKSHYHLSQFLTYLLGYHDRLSFSKKKAIVNGTMITREDGFITIESSD